jgi:hypothetical protein
VRDAASDQPSTERFDAGSAIVAGALALFLLSCALPWYGRSLSTASTAATLSVAGRVTASGPGWLVVAGLFLATLIACLGRSRVAVALSLVCCAVLVVGVVVLVRRFPTIPVPAGLARPRVTLLGRGETRLLGAALAVLATAVAAIGVVVHGATCARTWRAADVSHPRTA